MFFKTFFNDSECLTCGNVSSILSCPSLAIIKTNFARNHTQQHKLVCVIENTQSKVTTSDLDICNYKISCNQIKLIHLQQNHAIFIISPLSLNIINQSQCQSNNNISNTNINTNLAFTSVKVFGIDHQQSPSNHSFDIACNNKNVKQIQFEFYKLLKQMIKSMLNDLNKDIFIKNNDIGCIILDSKYKTFELVSLDDLVKLKCGINENDDDYDHDGGLNTHFCQNLLNIGKYKLFKVCLCLSDEDLINTVQNDCHIECLFPAYRFYNHDPHESDLTFFKLNSDSYNTSRMNSNPYSNYNNIDSYTNFDKSNINKLLFDKLCKFSTNVNYNVANVDENTMIKNALNALILDNYNLDSSKAFLKYNYNSTTIKSPKYNCNILIPNPWYHSNYNQFIHNGINSINIDNNKKYKNTIYITNCLWNQLFSCKFIPNNRNHFKQKSFYIVYYDGTTLWNGIKKKKCINKPIIPKLDIKLVFENKLLCHNHCSFVAITVNIRGVKNGVDTTKNQIDNDIKLFAEDNGYIIDGDKHFYCHNFGRRKMLLLVYKVYARKKDSKGNTWWKIGTNMFVVGVLGVMIACVCWLILS